MTGPNPILDGIGPVEGFARRAEHNIADGMRRLMHPHHDVPQPAAQPARPAMIATDTPEVTPMSVLTEGIDLARQAVARFEAVDHEALGKLEAIQANPATSEAYDVLGALTHLPPAELATGVSVLKMILTAAGGQAEAAASVPPESPSAGPQYAPTGPQVAGQA